MHFQRMRVREEPEVNLIPMIDVLLVILLFLMVTTTFSKLGELSVVLPKASMAQTRKLQSINIVIERSGRILVNGQPPLGQLSEALGKIADGNTGMLVVIDADAMSTQQSLITVMEAAREAGLDHIAFATRMSKS
ncbi:MAG: biopolymer transporter ExbD [Pseudomonadota bacterium]|nr:biopolymer transporter ExbD [Pseudomonadota bacterium]